MTISEAMRSSIEGQVMLEEGSSRLYRQMAIQCENIGLTGHAHWFARQAAEEQAHQERFIEYLTDQNLACALRELPAPSTPILAGGTLPGTESAGSITAFWQAVLDHEKMITAAIDLLKDQADNEGDHRTFDFLDWFTQEQVEEEARVLTILDRLALFGAYGAALALLDHDLGERA